MGQFQTSSSVPPEQDLFLQQIRVYRWRADPSVNLHLPRTYFKSASAQLQQEKFSQFLEQQQNKQYFCVSKFKEELRKACHTGDDQIILFESYECSLASFGKKMTLQQSLYALQGLLAGYQEIRKVYETIVVDATCCFITGQGSIRAWINPNVKFNRVWKQQEAESLRHNIIIQAIRMVEQFTQRSKQSQDFFANLIYNIAYLNLKNCGFNEVRRWIGEYCRIQKIEIGQRINVSKKKVQDGRVKESKIYKRNTGKTQASQRPDYFKENYPFFQSTQQSYIQTPFNQVKSLSKSIPVAPFAFQVKDINLPYSGVENSQKSSQLHRTTSQIFPVPPQIANYSTLTQPSGQPNILQKSSMLARRETYQSSQGMKNSEMTLNHNIFVSKNSKQCQFIPSKKLAEKEIQVQLDRIQINIKQVTRPKLNKEPSRNKIMEASIIRNIEQSSHPAKQHRYRTFNDRELSQQSSKKALAYSRQWITTKTITKLISDHQDKQSLKNSIAESSDYYNDSGYSGVLTQMGREVGKPVHQVRCKTLGASQQL